MKGYRSMPEQEQVQGSVAQGATDDYVPSPPYTVWWTDPAGIMHREGYSPRLESALELVKEMLERKPAKLLRIFQRIIVVDGGDFTIFEWLIDRGITWPPKGDPNEQRIVDPGAADG
jgi:hypothetical protein